ncbi:hypothetical protein AAFF_G00417700 [Aldrovandia affinis]|uniref:L-methionine (R)-S-oxide reductase n=1 Tax=Aldrovandia affinis TaxID=143900 RepID=A0AAD7WJ55_9TELE|nr:hypothetical protein AAFF_G00417700 [Aldrovandia affinis]
MTALLRSIGGAALRFAACRGRMSPRAPAWRLSLTMAARAAYGTKRTPMVFSQEELKRRLTPLQYHVTQERGTERAFRGEFTDLKEEGTYTCVVCGTPLFQSDHKFDSSSGWPSFFDLIKEESVTLSDDFAYAMHDLIKEESVSRDQLHLRKGLRHIHLGEERGRPKRGHSGHPSHRVLLSSCCGQHWPCLLQRVLQPC